MRGPRHPSSPHAGAQPPHHPSYSPHAGAQPRYPPTHPMQGPSPATPPTHPMQGPSPATPPTHRMQGPSPATPPTHPMRGLPCDRSNTWRGFSSHWNLCSSFAPWLPPLFGLMKTSSGRRCGDGIGLMMNSLCSMLLRFFSDDFFFLRIDDLNDP